MNAQHPMVSREFEGVGNLEIVEKHHGPVRATSRPNVDVRLPGILGTSPRQEPRKIVERSGSLPQPDGVVIVGPRWGAPYREIDTVDTNVSPPGEHPVGVITSSHDERLQIGIRQAKRSRLASMSST